MRFALFGCDDDMARVVARAVRNGWHSVVAARVEPVWRERLAKVLPSCEWLDGWESLLAETRVDAVLVGHERVSGDGTEARAMNTITNDAPRRVSEVLASMPAMAQAKSGGKKGAEPAQSDVKPGGQGDELLKWQLSVNASYWSMLAAKSAADGTAGAQAAAGSSPGVESVQRSKLASVYGAAGSGTIAGWSAVRVVPAGSELSLAA